MKMKTSLGVHDMQPYYLYMCARRHGFRENPKDCGMSFTDPFKKIDETIYTTITNGWNLQNAFCRMSNSLDTIEIVGHIFDQKLNLLEPSVNRLPDGTWMAIVRTETGNYEGNFAFTFSADGTTWEPANFTDLIPNGMESKPTFDLFNGVYYLGWQESTQINGVHRSVFNIETSTDGKTWIRKYRFEAERSFQYPTFKLYNGHVWLVVTEGNKGPWGNSKERIMFGMLE